MTEKIEKAEKPPKKPIVSVPVASTPATTIAAYATAITLIIGAIASGTVLIIKQTQTLKVSSENNDKLGKIEILVDGRYSEVLQELADLKQILADKTGRSEDRKKAIEAQRKADEQEQRVKNSKTVK